MFFRSTCRRVLLLVGVLILLLAVSVGCYNLYVERQMARRYPKPVEEVMPGAEPVTIDRGRSRACLLLHGFGSSPADFGELPSALDRAGWDVHLPRLPGHGTSPRDLAEVGYEDLYAAAEQELQGLRKRYEAVALCGFSMGGTIATGLAAEHDPEKLILVSPYYRVSYRWYYVLPARWWYGVLSPFLDYVRAGELPVNRPQGRGEIVAYRIFPVSALGELFELRDDVMRRAEPDELDMPVLLVYSGEDDVASPEAMRALLERLPNTGNRELNCPRSNHHILHDYGRHRAIRAIVDFLGGEERVSNPDGT